MSDVGSDIESEAWVADLGLFIACGRQQSWFAVGEETVRRELVLTTVSVSWLNECGDS